MSSQSNTHPNNTTTTEKDGGVVPGGGMTDGGIVRMGKENCVRGKEVEGLVIFTKRGGEIICREQVLSELRAKRTELGSL